MADISDTRVDDFRNPVCLCSTRGSVCVRGVAGWRGLCVKSSVSSRCSAVGDSGRSSGLELRYLASSGLGAWRGVILEKGIALGVTSSVLQS